MSEIGAAIRHVAGYMRDDESQAALGRLVDALDERSGAIRRLTGQVDTLETELARLRTQVERGDALAEALIRAGDDTSSEVWAAYHAYSAANTEGE